MRCVNHVRHYHSSFIIYKIDMAKEPEDYIAAVKVWILAKKEDMYNEFLKTETGNPSDLQRYEDQVMMLGDALLKAIHSENQDDLRKLNWPEELMECIQDPSVNLVIHNFIELACHRFPNTNSIYGLKNLKAQINSGLQ